MSRSYQLTFTSPGGLEFDASRYLEIGELGNINSVPESDLAVLTHSDLSLTLDNSDGEVEAFFLNADVDDIYHVALRRQREGTSEWDRVFGGILDLPYSLSYDDKAKTAHVICFSYSKKMERASAEDIKRTLADKTASITAGTSQLVFLAAASEAADLEIGDVVSLDDGSNREEFTIARIIDADNAATVEQASNGFTGAFVQVLTPYYHDQAPSFLLGEIATAADVTLNDSNLGDALADFPIATPLTLAGLHLDRGTQPWINGWFIGNGEPLSIVPTGTTVVATFQSAFGTKRKVLDAPDGTWTEGATSNTFQFDWTSYQFTEPASIRTYSGGATISGDAGLLAVDADTGDEYLIRAGGGVLRLHKNGVNQGDWLHSISSSTGVTLRVAIEWDPISDRVFMSNYSPSSSESSFQYWDGSAHDIETVNTVSGAIRCVRRMGTNLIILCDDLNNDLRIYKANVSPTAPSLVRIIPWHNTTTVFPDNVLMWTMRTWGIPAGGLSIGTPDWMTVLFERNHETWVAIYDASGDYDKWRYVAEYKIASALSSHLTGGDLSYWQIGSYQTIITDSGGTERAVVYAGGQWAVLSTAYDGVIRYADFSKSSCGKAARDIAVCMDAVVDVDAFQTLTIKNRHTLGSGNVVKDLGVPISSTRLPISEFYRSSVRVSGSTQGGTDIEDIQGEQGDSARRLNVDSDLITTPGMALACGLTTLQFVSMIREQRNVTVLDDGEPLHVFDRVTMDGKEWLIYKLETDLEQQIHTMTLLELQP